MRDGDDLAGVLVDGALKGGDAGPVGGLLGVEFQPKQPVGGMQANQFPGLAVIHQQAVAVDAAVEVACGVGVEHRRVTAGVFVSVMLSVDQ